MSATLTILITALYIFVLLTSPVWAGALIRIFSPTTNRRKLAGLISLPFTFWMIARSNIGSGIEAFESGLTGGKPQQTSTHLFAIGAIMLLLLLLSSIGFVIFRAMASTGIRLTDKVKSRKRKTWIAL